MLSEKIKRFPCGKMFSNSFMLFFITLLSLLFLFLFVLKRNSNIKKKLPPGPRKLPIIGNLHQLGKLPHKTLKNLSKKHGDIMFLKLGFVPAIVVSSPERAKDIFKNHDLVFSGRPPLYAAKKLSYNLSSISAAPYGEYWREMRKIMVLELMTLKRVKSFGNIRAEEVEMMIGSIADGAQNIPVDVSSLAFSLSNKVVCRVAFGTRNPVGDGKNIGFQQNLNEIQNLLGSFNVADYFPFMAWVNKLNGVDQSLEKNFQALDKFFDRVIKEHHDPMRPKSDFEDIIDVVLRLQNDPSRTMSPKDEHLKGILAEVFVAGTDTSAAVIEWTMAELMKNPLIKSKAEEEVRAIARGKSRVHESDLPNLTYLKHVIKESLRLHPPSPLLVPRETTDRCTIEGKYEIPAKTRVLFNLAAISTDPAYWENPGRFWPERFINSDVDFKGQHFEFLPFGAGRRGCPAINFSIPLVELALANLLYCFDWRFPEGISGEDLDMGEVIGITMHKKTPLCLIASSKDV